MPVVQSNVIFEDYSGYIKGYRQPDGYWWISFFAIHPEKRGLGLARKLAQNLPRKARLLACPLYRRKEPFLDKASLIRFYESLGFKAQNPDEPDLLTRG